MSGSFSTATPAFGQADLSNCEREQIHLAGSIQPHGVLLVVREPDHVVVQASVNAGALLGLTEDPVGRPLAELPGNLAACIAPHLNVPVLHTLPLGVRCRIGAGRRRFDLVLHRPPQGGLVIELEPAEATPNRARQVEVAIRRILAAVTLRAVCDETARTVRELTGYDRVMVYRFDAEGHGEVFAEERLDALEPYLGNRYPASDIPQIARRLYERNRVRVLVDVGYAPVPIEPATSPITGQPLDMSLCLLRSISPIHVQYLKNMGVAATLVVSLMVGGRLWGLVACHHGAPRTVAFEGRAVCELLAEAVATRIAALESSLRGQAEIAVRRLEQRLVETIPRDGDWRTALFDHSQSVLAPLRASGAGLMFEGQVLSTGEVPGTQQLRDIVLWLDGKPRAPVIATASLGLDQPQFAPIKGVASGLLAVPLSTTPGEYLLWFRQERVRTVVWGGDPSKAVVTGATPADLSPRRSFAQWHQVVDSTSDPWTEADLGAARLIGDTMRDVILQFRSVGMLIAKEQLDRVSRQVAASELPVIVADKTSAGGEALLLVSEGFRRLQRGGPTPTRMAEVADLFADPAACRAGLRTLTERGQAWRAEVLLRHPGTPLPGTPLLVRADPVFSAPGHISGYVLLFTDLTQQKAAEAARHAFQERIIERGRLSGSDIAPRTEALFQDLLSCVIENAQLAALEITDGVDAERLPEMLDSVRASVARTRRALEHLAWHADSVAAES